MSATSATSAPGRAAVVVGLGQEAAGDDAVGLHVARRLVTQGVPALVSTEATLLVTLLVEGHEVVIVDAVVGGGAPGDVVHVRPDELAAVHVPVLSSHGLGVAPALALAGLLRGATVLDAVQIVGVIVSREALAGPKLSPAVAAAVGPAAALAARLADQGRIATFITPSRWLANSS